MTVFAAIKDPSAVKDYQINWADPAAPGGPFLTGGDTITASTWTVYDPTGAVLTLGPLIVINSSSFTTTTTTVVLSGGTLGVEYLIVNHISTVQSRQEDQTIIILCINT